MSLKRKIKLHVVKSIVGRNIQFTVIGILLLSTMALGVVKTFSRAFKTTSVLQQPRSLIKLRKLQADFQCEDGRPIWLKRGFSDRILYSSTIIGCYVGVIMVLATIYDHAKPESWKTPAC